MTIGLQNWRRALVGVAALGLVGGWAPAATAQGAATSFKGKNINLIIGYSVGGGYDLNARLLSRYIGKHIPGDPSIIAQNMPGAGSLKALKYIYEVAPKDGTAIGTFGRSVPLQPLFGLASFDARKLTWLGSITSDTSVCVTWKSSPIKTKEDLMTKPGKFAGQGSGSDTDIFTETVKNLFNPKIKLVTGYPGSNEGALAMERGEVDGECGVSWSSLSSKHADWIRDKKIHVLLQMALEKDPDLPNVPALLDLVKDKETRSVLKVILASQTFARPFAAAPGVPAATAATLRNAFDETMKDPDFIAEAKKLRLEVRPVSGAKLEGIIAELYATPPALLAKAKVVEGLAH